MIRIKSAIAYRVHPAVAGRFHELSIAELCGISTFEGDGYPNVQNSVGL